MEPTKEMKIHMRNIMGLVICYREGSVWLPGFPEDIAECERLTSKGWALEITPLHISENGQQTQGDRCWQLTVKGAQETKDMEIIERAR